VKAFTHPWRGKNYGLNKPGKWHTDTTPHWRQPELGIRTVNYRPIGIRTVNYRPIGIRTVNYRPIGIRTVNYRPIGIRTVNYKPIGIRTVNYRPIGIRTVNYRPIGILATGYRLDDLVFESWWGRDFTHMPRPALGPTEPRIQRIMGLFPRDKAAESWRWLPTPYNPEVKERTELYPYSPPRPSWPVTGWTSPLNIFIRVSPVEIQSPTHWNMIGDSMAARPPVLSPSNILPPCSPHGAFIPARRISARFNNFITAISFLRFLKLCESAIKSGSVRTLGI